MTGRLLLMIGGCLTCWVLVCLPARALLDDPDLRAQVIGYSGAGLGLCLVPALLTLWWARSSLSKAPDEQMMAILGGTGIRLFATLGAAWALTLAVPFFRASSFWNWLLGAYLVTLALEMTLVLAGRAPMTDSVATTSEPTALASPAAPPEPR